MARHASHNPAPAPATDGWTGCTLAVSGPIAQLERFLARAEGPGFLDWRPDFLAIEGLPAATARRLRDVHERALLQAELDPYRCPLDFDRLHPIPDDIRQRRYTDAARRWMQENWGPPWPPPWVDFRMTLRRGRQTAVFSFLTFARVPYPLLTHVMRAWIDLRFELDLDGREDAWRGAA